MSLSRPAKGLIYLITILFPGVRFHPTNYFCNDIIHLPVDMVRILFPHYVPTKNMTLLCGGGFMDFIHRPKSKILKILKN
jgi:hypothetical protein